MAGLCEDGNEPPGSLKARTPNEEVTNMERLLYNRGHAVRRVEEITTNSDTPSHSSQCMVFISRSAKRIAMSPVQSVWKLCSGAHGNLDDVKAPGNEEGPSERNLNFLRLWAEAKRIDDQLKSEGDSW
ncbi:hypothetical protein ANN_02557, partial [Periplaneta americana]